MTYALLTARVIHSVHLLGDTSEVRVCNFTEGKRCWVGSGVYDHFLGLTGAVGHYSISISILPEDVLSGKLAVPQHNRNKTDPREG